MPLKEALKVYNPNKLKDGYNVLESGEEIFYISNPALGLWADEKILINLRLRRERMIA